MKPLREENNELWEQTEKGVGGFLDAPLSKEAKAFYGELSQSLLEGCGVPPFPDFGGILTDWREIKVPREKEQHPFVYNGP